MSDNGQASQEKAMAYIDKLATALREKQPHLTQERAVTQVLKDDPGLYGAYEVGARYDQGQALAASKAANGGA